MESSFESDTGVTVLLCPWSFRENGTIFDPASPRREFGTQTGTYRQVFVVWLVLQSCLSFPVFSPLGSLCSDQNVAKQIRKALGQEESSDTTDIEYRPPPKPHKRVRLRKKYTKRFCFDLAPDF